MTTTSSLEEVQKALDSKSRTEFMNLIKKNREQRLKSFEKILEGILKELRKSTLSSIVLNEIQQKLQKLRGLVEQKESDRLSDSYIVAVYQLAGNFDPLVEIEQGENRFLPLDSDSTFTKIGKGIKRWGRYLTSTFQKFLNYLRRKANKPEKNYEPWKQRIPLKQVIEYSLFARTELPKWWINEDEQVLLTIISGLERFLAEEYRADQKTSESDRSAHLEETVEQLLQQVQEKQSVLENELEEDRLAVNKLLMHHFEKAGTFEKRASFYSRSRIERTKSQAARNLSDHSGEWQKVQQSLLKKAEIINEFLVFRNGLRLKSRDLSDSLEKYFESHFIDKIEKLNGKLNAVQAELKELDNEATKKAKVDFLTGTRKKLDEQLNNLQDLLSVSLEKRELTGMIERFSEQMLLLANEISEEALIVEDLEVEKNPPTFDAKTIEWRLLVIRALKEQLLDKLNPSEQNYDAFINEQINEIREVREVVEVNLSSSLELLETEETENPVEIAWEALERSQLKLKQCVNSVKEKQEKLTSTVFEEGKLFSDKLLLLLQTGDPGEFQMLDAKYRVKETAQGWKTKWKARWARIQDSFILLGRFGLRKTKKYLRSIYTFFGYGEETAKVEQKADITNYLTETDSQASPLPYIYRRLFNFDAETDRRFYVALNENFTYLSKAYNSWKNGFPSTIAVVGEKGSGKSTYLNFAIEEVFSGRNVIRIILTETYWSRAGLVKLLKSHLNLSKADSLEAIITAFKKRKRNNVIVLEGLQNLYLRNLNGYEALETLLYVISETKDSIFWITSCSSYAWSFLQKTSSLGDYYTHLIRSDNLSDEQIQSLIMKRHEASGYELIFEAGETQSKNRAYRKLLDKEEKAQQYLRETYFKELAKISEGNASIAMIFWIRSIRSFSDTHFYIAPMEVTSLQLVENLEPDILFTLAALVLHDTLTPEQLSMILQFNEEESRMMLIRLKTKGLLQQSGEQYKLNHLMYRQVVKSLKERNIIHLYGGDQ